MTDAESSSRSSAGKSYLDSLLERLAADHPDPGMRYEQLRRKLVRYFAWEQCAFPEDLADEAIDRLSRKLAEQESIRDVESYLSGIARLLVKEESARRRREEKLLSELGRHNLPVAPVPDEISLERLNNCLQNLPMVDRSLLLSYYAGDGRNRIQNRQKLADELHISLGALRSRVWRIRELVEACFGGPTKRGDASAKTPTKDVGKR